MWTAAWQFEDRSKGKGERKKGSGMNEAEIRQGLHRFCESWNRMIPLLKGNHLVEPLDRRDSLVIP